MYKRQCQTLRKVDASYREGELPELRDEDFAEVLDDACKMPEKAPAAEATAKTGEGERRG